MPVVPLAKILKVKPEKVIDFLVVPLGTKVEKGDLLAIKKGFFGKEKRVTSKVKGFLKSLSSTTGELLIEKRSVLDKSKALEGKQKKGRVESDKKPATQRTQKPTENTEVKKSKSSVASGDSVSQCCGVFGFGTGEGELVFFSEPLEFTKLEKKLKGKIVFAPSLNNLASIFKARALGISGLVVGFLKKREGIEKEICGKIDLGFLLLSEKEDKEKLRKIKSWKGKRVRVEGEKEKIQLLS